MTSYNSRSRESTPAISEPVPEANDRGKDEDKYNSPLRDYQQCDNGDIGEDNDEAGHIISKNINAKNFLNAYIRQSSDAPSWFMPQITKQPY